MKLSTQSASLKWLCLVMPAIAGCVELGTHDEGGVSDSAARTPALYEPAGGDPSTQIAVDLGVELDQPEYVWSSSTIGASHWFGSQTRSYDGEDSATVGDGWTPAGTSSTLATSTNESVDGTLSFFWAHPYSTIGFSIDSVEHARLDGASSYGWHYVQAPLAAGPHDLDWTLNFHLGGGEGRIDSVEFTPHLEMYGVQEFGQDVNFGLEINEYPYPGHSVAIDGDWAVAGVPAENNQQGAAYVFRFEAGRWAVYQRLFGLNAPVGTTKFGESVTIDGDSIAIGSLDKTSTGASFNGAAYAFHLDQTTNQWVQNARLAPASSSTTWSFGQTIALSRGTLAVGEPLAAVNGLSNAGRVHTYVLASGTWQPAQIITAAVPQGGSKFGLGLAVQDQVNYVGVYSYNKRLIVGAPRQAVSGLSGAGAVHVFTGSDAGQWQLFSEFSSVTPTAGAEFGTSVSISGDYVAIGAPSQSVDGASLAGRVFVRRFAEATFSGAMFEVPTPEVAAGQRFGQVVDLDERHLVVSAVGAHTGGATGQAFVYSLDGETGTFVDPLVLTASNPQDHFGYGNRFGRSLAIDGGAVFVGSRAGDDHYGYGGSLHFFDRRITLQVREGAQRTTQRVAIAKDHVREELTSHSLPEYGPGGPLALNQGFGNAVIETVADSVIDDSDPRFDVDGLRLSFRSTTMAEAEPVEISRDFHATMVSRSPGTSVFWPNDELRWIEYIPGTLPLLLTAGHGGKLQPAEIPNRTGTRPDGTPAEMFNNVNDDNVEQLAVAISDEMFAELGARPHVVLNHLHRRKVDMNRPLEDAVEHPRAEQAWNQFHRFIVEARREIIAMDGTGFVVDLHGHGHSVLRLELGYNISGDDLRALEDLADDLASGGTLDETERAYVEGLIEESTVRLLAEGDAEDFLSLISGPRAFGTFLENENADAVPSSQDPAPQDGQAYLNGGYLVERYGSVASTVRAFNEGAPMSGVQIEAQRTGLRDTATNRALFAARFVPAVREYMIVNYDIDLASP